MVARRVNTIAILSTSIILSSLWWNDIVLVNQGSLCVAAAEFLSRSRPSASFVTLSSSPTSTITPAFAESVSTAADPHYRQLQYIPSKLGGKRKSHSKSGRSTVFNKRTEQIIAPNHHLRSSTLLAAIMTPDDGTSATTTHSSSSSATSPFPNWRVVPQEGVEGVVCSPFCHPLPPKGSQLQQEQSHHHHSRPQPTAQSAPWSETAYHSALYLHDKFTHYIHRNSNSNADSGFSSRIASALHDLSSAYRLYGPHCMVGSYNGGKDACVIFHLMRAVHADYCRGMLMRHQQEAEAGSGNCFGTVDNVAKNSSGYENDVEFAIPRPRVIYFQHRDEFPEVVSLLHDTVREFDVDMLAFREGISFPEGLTHLVERNVPPHKNGFSYYTTSPSVSDGTHAPYPAPPPHPLAFILGTRKNDPNAGSQGVYAPSSHYMPPFMRVNPILDWEYNDVWKFLREFDLPYCSLYDKGFTSLGTVKDTLPCPALKKDRGDGEGGYWPAYMLEDWSLERAGRIAKPKKVKKQTSTTTTTTTTTAMISENEERSFLMKLGREKSEERSSRLADVTMSQTSSTVSLSTLDVTNHSSTT
ncbi:hypothetical protein ACHAXS_013596 [Conticribra weissflogii]